MTSMIDAESILVADVGSMYTRAILFDIVDRHYRFVAKGVAKTTAAAPEKNVGEGLRRAIAQLQEITGHRLLDADHRLILPASGDGSGVDRFAACLSAGRPLQVVVVGLLDELSGESARRLAQTTYSNVVDTIHLNDSRTPEARLNLLVAARPDLLICAGGSDGGASKSVLSILETVGLACYLLPGPERPVVLFAGNESICEDVKSILGNLASVECAPNIRPSQRTENVEAAQLLQARTFIQQRAKNLAGIGEIRTLAGEGLLPGATAFSRVIRFLSVFLKEKKGVLGVDLGSSATVVAAAWDGDCSTGVYPHLGLNAPAERLLEQFQLDDLRSWLTVDISAGEVKEYLYNRSLRPGSLPGTKVEAEIELALARQILREAVRLAGPGFPGLRGGASLPSFEPILATGSLFSRLYGYAESALLLLDGLQPVGISTLILDQNQIAPAVGAAAALNSLLAVQVMDSNAFMNLGTVIATQADVRAGQPVLRIKMVYESGHESEIEVKQGSLEVISLPYGQKARLVLQPLHRADIGLGAPGRGGSVTVKGGLFGVLIDARGRPLVLPESAPKRQELYKKWLWSLGVQ